ncbi:MAG: helicase C-terminal domain-containing protein [Candidatus Heimdallarchaeota archaeon]
MPKESTKYTRFWERLNEVFPYPSYRQEQFSIISAIQKENQKTIMIDAETGSGKTAAVLSAVLSKKEDDERVIIFTKMLGQIDAWLRELGLVNDFNRKINQHTYSIIPLVGKKHICPLVTKKNQKSFSQIGCPLFDCNRNRSFGKISTATGGLEVYSQAIVDEVKEKIRKGVGLSDILWYLENRVDNIGCSYLALKSAMKQAEIIITTYPFLTNSRLRELLLEDMGADLEKTTIIVDEAHNLANANFGNLSYRVLNKAFSEIGFHPMLHQLKELEEKDGLHDLYIDTDELRDLQKIGKEFLLEQFEKGYLGISFALRVYEFLSNSDFCYLTADKKFNLYLKDPRQLLNPMKRAKQLILLSGTFRPLNHFADFLGITDAQKISVLSEKLGKNRIVITTNDPNLNMRYKERTPERYIYYAEIINQLLPKIPGHVLVFTPNYEISTVLANVLETKHFEKPNQNISQIITAVRSSEDRIVLVAPARGKISEGIEFVKNDKSLISAVMIAGLPYPPPSRSLNEIIREYSKFWGEDRAINYMNYLQGIVTMRQCLGRMIRSENDIGAWIILDNRINHINIFSRAIECKNVDKMKERLHYFYDSHGFK